MFEGAKERQDLMRVGSWRALAPSNILSLLASLGALGFLAVPLAASALLAASRLPLPHGRAPAQTHGLGGHGRGTRAGHVHD